MLRSCQHPFRKIAGGREISAARPRPSSAPCCIMKSQARADLQAGFLTRKSSKKMDGSQLTKLQLKVSLTDATVEDLDYSIRQPLRELMDMQVAWPQLMQGDAPPRASKVADPITTGSILITFSPSVLPDINEVLQARMCYGGTIARSRSNRGTRWTRRTNSHSLRDRFPPWIR
jgi:hypothetical protein